MFWAINVGREMPFAAHTWFRAATYAPVYGRRASLAQANSFRPRLESVRSRIDAAISALENLPASEKGPATARAQGSIRECMGLYETASNAVTSGTDPAASERAVLQAEGCASSLGEPVKTGFPVLPLAIGVGVVGATIAAYLMWGR